jgi:hypothetical protein
MTNYGKPRPEPTQNPTLKSKEERKELLEEVERRRRIIYSRFYQKQRLESREERHYLQCRYFDLW